MALSSIAERQLQSQSQGGPATIPNMFDFSQKQPQKEDKFLTKDEVKQVLSTVSDKKAGLQKLLDSGYELEGYKELQAQPVETPGFASQSGDFLGALSVAPYKAVGGLGAVLGDVVSAPFSDTVSYGGIFTGGNQGGLGQFFRNTSKNIEQGVTGAYGVDTGTTGYKAGEITGGIATALATPGSLAGKIGQAGSIAGKLGLGAAEGALQTAKGFATTEGRLGTPTELATGAAFGAGLTGAGMAFNKFSPGVREFFSRTPVDEMAAGKAAGLGDDAATAQRAAAYTEAATGKQAKAIVDGMETTVPAPGIIEKGQIAYSKALSDPVKLAGKALTPSYAGKTPKQIVNAFETTEKNTKKLWGMVRKGEIEGDLSSLEGAARTVVDGLDSVGAKIGGYIKNAKGIVSLSDDTVKEIQDVMSRAAAKRTPVTQTLQNLIDDLDGGLDMQEAFALKKVYQNEIQKYIKAGDAGTDQFSALVKGTQELSDQIDDAVMKLKGGKDFAKLKEQYKTLKTIAGDITRSAQVEARKSPMGLVEQLGFLDAVTDPRAFVKQQFAKNLSEMNSRGGTWKQLMSIYDDEAIKAYKATTKKPKNISVKTEDLTGKKSTIKSKLDLLKNNKGFIDFGAIAEDLKIVNKSQGASNIAKTIEDKYKGKLIGAGDGSYYYALDDGTNLRVSNHSNVNTRGSTDRAITTDVTSTFGEKIKNISGEVKFERVNPDIYLNKLSPGVFAEELPIKYTDFSDGQILATFRKNGGANLLTELYKRGRNDLLEKIGIDESILKKSINKDILNIEDKMKSFLGKSGKPLPTKKEMYKYYENRLGKIIEIFNKANSK